MQISQVRWEDARDNLAQFLCIGGFLVNVSALPVGLLLSVHPFLVIGAWCAGFLLAAVGGAIPNDAKEKDNTAIGKESAAYADRLKLKRKLDEIDRVSYKRQ